MQLWHCPAVGMLPKQDLKMMLSFSSFIRCPAEAWAVIPQDPWPATPLDPWLVIPTGSLGCLTGTQHAQCAVHLPPHPKSLPRAGMAILKEVLGTGRSRVFLCHPK